MNYSSFYHDWLQLDFQGEEPTYYEILGLNAYEPDIQKIAKAVDSVLDRFQNIDWAENSEAYNHIFHQILTVRRVLLTASLKEDYDGQLSSTTGQRFSPVYQRPSLQVRLRQMGLIAVSFFLGCGVMLVMASMVERNIDGSIAFHKEAKAEKPLPFTLPLEHVVYRPVAALDYNEKGYATVRNASLENTPDSVSTVVAENSDELNISTENQASDSSGKNLPGTLAQTEDSTLGEDGQMELSAILPDSMLSAGTEAQTGMNTEAEDSFLLPQNPSRQVAQDELAALLPDVETQISPEVSETGQGVAQRRNPVYGYGRRSTEVAHDDSSLTSVSPELTSETSTLNPSSDAVTSMPPVQDSVPAEISPKIMLELLEEVHAKMDFLKPGTAEAFALLRFQTCSKVLQKLIEGQEISELPELNQFIEYSLSTATDLGWEKHFDEAFQLCDALNELAAKQNWAEEITSILKARYAAIQRYQNIYEKSLRIRKALEEDPENPDLNWQYAIWLWRETGNLEKCLPYFAKCKSEIMREAANFELQLKKNPTLKTPDALVSVADRWWDISLKIKDERLSASFKEHARTFYEEVDRTYLNEQQIKRISRLTDTARK